MSNPLKDMLDMQKRKLEIDERNYIIDQYYMTGILNRTTAIQKIQELRMTNKTVAEITVPRILASLVPFDCATDEQLLTELKMQIAILETESIQKPEVDKSEC